MIAVTHILSNIAAKNVSPCVNTSLLASQHANINGIMTIPNGETGVSGVVKKMIDSK
ncbi:MAG: hypothetical protein WC216_06685 [Gallionella sp.]|jgi:hypothetical protein